MKKHLNRIFGIAMAALVIASCRQDETEFKNNTDDLSSFSNLLVNVEHADSADQYLLVEEFIDSLEFPFIENDSTVYFLYHGDATTVSIAGDFTLWNPVGRSFTKLKDTQLWYRKESFEPEARLDYKLVIDQTNWILDPRNPNQISGGFGFNSELAMPNYQHPTEIQERPNIPKGTVSNFGLQSSITGKTYKIYTYLPAEYDNSRNYPTAYFQDGEDYLNLAHAKTVMDNLIADGRIAPMIGIFVVPTNRNFEYAFEGRFDYSSFFVNELVPHIDANFSTIAQASERAVIGDSYGGNISAIIAFQNPEVFGNCGIHSGAFRQFNFHTNSIIMDEVKKDIKVASIWGTYEGQTLPPNMRKIRDYLVEEDYEVYSKELPEGHSWGLWRATLDDMLIFFFPK